MHKPFRRTAALILALLSLSGLLPVEARAGGSTCSVNTDKVFLRMKANTGSGYYDLLMKGEKVELLGVNGDFYKVKFKTYTGFVMRKFLTVPSEALKELNADAKPSAESTKTTSSQGDGKASGYACSVNSDKVFLRMKANTSSGYYDLLNKGEKVELLGVNGDFYKVKFKTYTGFVMRKFLSVPSAALKAFNVEEKPAGKYAGVKTISGLGDAPRASDKGSSGDHVEKLQRALQIKGYLKGSADGIYGDMTVQAVRKYQQAVKLGVNGAADSATIAKLFGVKAETTARDDPGMAGISSISQLSVPNTTSPGSSGKHVKALQQALKLKGYYKEAIDSSYGKSTQEAVKRYQRAVGLGADGVAGYATIRKLFGKNAANYTIPTEKLDWFNGGKNIIPQWASFTVKDVGTGKTFKVRRWSGYNHVDAEPLSEADAKVMKEIAGGSFSWARRAVLVKYDGHVYAASITTMPHGTDSIPGNGFDGHFCMHFYKSKTHETNKVDATHQNAVARAMNAGW